MEQNNGVCKVYRICNNELGNGIVIYGVKVKSETVERMDMKLDGEGVTGVI